ncbi:hypothetical protein QO004_006089 [Rhizobium mesoamericanum]|nr:hypothetical protein [Rhizobium mesoamericanum]
MDCKCAESHLQTAKNGGEGCRAFMPKSSAVRDYATTSSELSRYSGRAFLASSPKVVPDIALNALLGHLQGAQFCRCGIGCGIGLLEDER